MVMCRYLETRGCWPDFGDAADLQPWLWSVEVALGSSLMTPRQERYAPALEFSVWGNS